MPHIHNKSGPYTRNCGLETQSNRLFPVAPLGCKPLAGRGPDSNNVKRLCLTFAHPNLLSALAFLQPKRLRELFLIDGQAACVLPTSDCTHTTSRGCGGPGRQTPPPLPGSPIKTQEQLNSHQRPHRQQCSFHTWAGLCA